MPAHLIIFRSLSSTLTMQIVFYSLIFYALLLPIMGILSDRIGKENLMFLSSFLILIFSYPFYNYLNTSSNVAGIILILLISMVPIVALNAPLPALLCELFFC